MGAYDELLELILKYSSNKIKELAKWILRYQKADNKKEQELKYEKQLFFNRFDRMIKDYEQSSHRERLAVDRRIFEYYSSYIKSMIPNAYVNDVNELCFKSKWRDAGNLIMEIEKEIEYNEYEKEYGKLITDTEYLIVQLLGIMKNEYAKRLETSKDIMKEYAEPHKNALGKLDDYVDKARDERKKIEKSELVLDGKEEILKDIDRRIAEMESIKRRELDNLQDAKILTDEIQKASRAFDDVILSMERKKDQIEERKKYVGVVEKLKDETSKMDILFMEMNDEFRVNIEKIKASLELLNSAFQTKIGDVILDQDTLNRIFESGATSEFGDAASLDRMRNSECYEYILRILKERNG